VSNALIVALVCGGIALVLLFMVPVGIGFYLGFRRALNVHAAPTPAGPVTLSQTYATTNGLVTVHYPADFAAKHLDDATVMLARNLVGGEDEAVTVGAVRKPISDDVHEFARVLLNVIEKNVTAKGGTFTKTGEHVSTCLGAYPGLEVDATYTVPAGVGEYTSRSCIFIHGGHGYELRYDVSTASLAAEAPLLERIENATDLVEVK
jgi:hypothetical protein